MINYIHRVGRTGRANRKGKAITLYTDIDKPLLRSLGNMLKTSVNFINFLEILSVLLRDVRCQIGFLQ